MTRRQRNLLIVVGVFVFLGISALLTKAFVGAGAERARVRDALQAQASGNADAMLALMPDCRADATCSQITRQRVARLKRPGEVQILNFVPSIEVTFTDHSGRARVAWRTAQSKFPVVQCVQVDRQGPLTGGGVTLVSFSNPIGLSSSC